MTAPFTQARWIWSAEPGDARHAVRHFRGTFTLADARTVTCRVSADSRYLLFLDGNLIGRGPARSDLRHYVYETHTLPLSAGLHVLAALVLFAHGPQAPVAEMHDQGAFVLEAQDASGNVVLATGNVEDWRVHRDTAYQPAPMTGRETYYAIGATEDVNGAALPHGWEKPGFADGGWERPVVLCAPYLRERSNDLADPGGRRRLIPRDIPPLREEPRRFSQSPDFPLTVPARSRREFILDAGEYACGYPVLQVAGGAGGRVEIVYAEAKTTDKKKAVRDQGADVVGIADTYRSGGGTETYSPLQWRAFRFVKMVVQTADAPLTVRDLSYTLTGYPWQRKAAFTVADGPAELPAVLDTDFRTLERCTAETFMDCPYYEQLQYVGDTRLQALLSYVTTGDTRLGARAVRLFNQSRTYDGLTQSRYPSAIEQVIPPFSLIWVLMVEDLWRYAPGEAQTVADCLPGCRGILEWFGKRLTPDGVLGGPLPWWNFVDWADGWPDGVPPPAAAGLPSATINLQYLAALQAYVRLHEAVGDTRESEFWQAEADMLADAILQTFWDPDARLLREGPDDGWGCTQHAQAWGILTGLIPDGAMDDVVESLHEDDTLTRATFYQSFYVVEALAKAGRLERLWDHWLAPWRGALALGLTTWPEKPEPTRSDCHAWSAWPTYTFLTHVLGVRPTEAGFAAWQVSPQRVTGWEQITGTIPVPSGLLTVSVGWTDTAKPRIAISGPD